MASRATFDDLLGMVRRLRADGGCPWDRDQTPRSLLPYLIEEAYEVRAAILEEDDRELAGELGDLALHVAFQSVLAEERGAFGADAVFRRVLDKMLRRHPHVFGPRAGSGAAGSDTGPSAPGSDSAAAHTSVTGWEELKRRERPGRGAPGGLLDGIPPALPALLEAQRMQERAAEAGFDWPDAAGALQKLREELGELAALVPDVSALGPERDRAHPAGPLAGAGAEAGEGARSNPASGREARAALEEELGDLLFAAVNVSRKLGLVAEDCLERAAAKFRRRFEALETLAASRGIDVSSAGLRVLDGLWDEVKRAGERAPPP